MILQDVAALGVALALSAAAFVVLWLDRFKGEPVMRLILMAGWGAACAAALRLAAPALVAPGGPGSGVEGSATAAAGAPVIVQLLLAAGLAALATSHFLDGPLDGAAYGTVTGLGYAAFQAAASLVAGGSPAAPGAPVVAALAQAGTTALVGGAFGFAKLALRGVSRVAAVLVAALLAGLAQWGLTGAAVWAGRRWGGRVVWFELALAVAGVLLLAAVAWAALAFERRVLTRQLSEEVALGVLPGWVVGVIPSYGKRIRADWWPRRDERREVVRLLTALAYRKQRLLGLSELRANLLGLEVGRLRHRAHTLLALDPRGGSRGEDEP